MKRGLRIAIYFACMLLLLGIAVFGVWAGTGRYDALPGAEDGVTYTNAHGFLVVGDEDADTALVLYPGAKVEADAYLPLAEEIAGEDTLVLIARMPLRLAFFRSGAALRAQRLWPEVERWFVGGHSLGGAMAASCAAAHQDRFQGVVLLAAYSAKPLTEVRVLTVFGSADEVLNRERYAACAGNLPAGYTETEILGGNHALFGVYGAQKGDGEATVTPGQQRQGAARVIRNFLYEDALYGI